MELWALGVGYFPHIYFRVVVSLRRIQPLNMLEIQDLGTVLFPTVPSSRMNA
jgi:hypothetical protein